MGYLQLIGCRAEWLAVSSTSLEMDADDNKFTFDGGCNERVGQLQYLRQCNEEAAEEDVRQLI